MRATSCSTTNSSAASEQLHTLSSLCTRCTCRKHWSGWPTPTTSTQTCCRPASQTGTPRPTWHPPSQSRGVKLGPTYFIPNLQIGSFGGITPLLSLLKDRSQLWDVAAAGPIAGVSASIALLAIGLSQSHPGGLPQVCTVAVM